MGGGDMSVDYMGIQFVLANTYYYWNIPTSTWRNWDMDKELTPKETKGYVILIAVVLWNGRLIPHITKTRRLNPKHYLSQLNVHNNTN